MEYELRRNASRSTSADDGRHVRGGVAIQRENRNTSVAVDEPSGAFGWRPGVSSN
jgi:hypothetical protein